MRTEYGSAFGLKSTAMNYRAAYHWSDAAGSAQSTALVRYSGVSAGSLAQCADHRPPLPRVLFWCGRAVRIATMRQRSKQATDKMLEELGSLLAVLKRSAVGGR